MINLCHWWQCCCGGGITHPAVLATFALPHCHCFCGNVSFPQKQSTGLCVGGNETINLQHCWWCYCGGDAMQQQQVVCCIVCHAWLPPHLVDCGHFCGRKATEGHCYCGQIDCSSFFAPEACGLIVVLLFVARQQNVTATMATATCV